MKKQLLTLLIAGVTLPGFAQVTPPDGAVAPQASTADAPQWYAMMSSHMTAADRQNRWLYYDGSRLATEQYADGLDMQQENITQFAWRLEEYTDDYGMSGVRLINYDGEEVQVPATAEAIANTQLLMVPSGEGSTWELMTSASTGQIQCAEMQYVLDWTGKTMKPHAYLNAMDGSVTDNAFGVTIYDAGAHQASGWFFVPLDIEDEPTEPASWTIVKSKRMSATSTYDVDVTDVITTDDPGYIGVFNNTDGSNGAIFDGEQSCYGMYEPQPSNFIGVSVNIEEAGTYKFNYRTRLTDYGTVSVQLVYSGTQPYEENFEPASDVIEIPASTTLPAQQIESNEIELQAGEYLFALNMTEISYDAFGPLFVGDFNLYKKGAAPVEQAPLLTWAAPENGTIAVTVAGETVESGAEVEAGTEVVATFTPAEGYELETVTLGGEDVTTDVVDGVLTFVMGEEDVKLAATFSAVQPEYTWRVVDSDPMSGTDNSWDKSESFRGKYATETGPSTGNGAVIDGYSYCMGAMATQDDDFIGHYVEVAQSGTYKVSFSARLDNSGGASSDASVNVAIYYAEGVTMNNSEGRLGDQFNKAGEDVTLTLTNNLPATMVESQEVQLEAGTRYAFAVNVTSYKNTGYSTLYVGDFKLMKQVQAGEIETYTVTWAEPENGTLTVTADTGTLQSGATVEAGTSITVTATPDEGYELETLTVGGKTFTSGESYVVEANTEIVATFAEIPPTMYTVSWTEPENGTLTVTTDTGTLQSGATVEAGTSITVTATPDEGYELETLTVGGKTFTSGESYVVEANTEIEATFAEVPPTMYTVSWTADNCDITVKTAEGTTVENGDEVAEGTELTITATAADGYELESLTVNGDDFENGATWTVAGDVTIVATVRGTGIDEAMADGIYYDAASQTLYVGEAQALSVYDVTGRKVVETAVDGTFDASALRGGIYIAVVDGKVVKFRK